MKYGNLTHFKGDCQSIKLLLFSNDIAVTGLQHIWNQ